MEDQQRVARLAKLEEELALARTAVQEQAERLALLERQNVALDALVKLGPTAITGAAGGAAIASFLLGPPGILAGLIGAASVLAGAASFRTNRAEQLAEAKRSLAREKERLAFLEGIKQELAK